MRHFITLLILATALAGCAGAAKPTAPTPTTAPIEAPAPPSANPIPDGTRLYIGLAPADCVNLREQPSKQAKAVTCLPGGAKATAATLNGSLTATADNETWIHIRTADGKTGWAATGAGKIGAVFSREQLSGLGQFANGSLYTMRDFLGAASGAYDPCAGAKAPCMIDDDPGRVVSGLLEQCGKLMPQLQTNAPNYDPIRDDYWIQALTATCGALDQAAKQLGAPAASPAWKQRLTDIFKALPPEL